MSRTGDETVLSRLRERETSTVRLEEAVTAYRAVLEELPRECVQQAIAAYGFALEIYAEVEALLLERRNGAEP